MARSAPNLWEDPSFTPSSTLNAELDKDLRSLVDCWLRPGDSLRRLQHQSTTKSSPEFFAADAADPTHVHQARQGSLGNCFFVAAASLLAAIPGGIRSLIAVPWDPASGRVAFRFHVDCAQVIVEVDDRLPCTKTGRCAFAHMQDSSCFWLPLLEKAFAKLHGGYGQLIGGSLSECLHELQGTPVLDYNLDDVRVKQEWLQSGHLWQQLQRAGVDAWLSGAAHVCDAKQEQARTSLHGLAINHAYSVLGSLHAHGQQLLQLRNPWGKHALGQARRQASKGLQPFVGWSDKLVAAADEALQNGKLRSAEGILHPTDSTQHVSSQSGTFWVTWSAFLAHFNRLYLCVPSEGARQRSLPGTWGKHSAGGCSTFPTWTLNPVFSLQLPAALVRLIPHVVRAFVTVHQPDARRGASHGKPTGAELAQEPPSETPTHATSLPRLVAGAVSVVSPAAAGTAAGAAAAMSTGGSPTALGETLAAFGDESSAIQYPQVGVAVVLPKPGSMGPQALCNGWYTVVAKSSYWNKREASVELGLASSASGSGAMAEPHAGQLGQLLSPTSGKELSLLVVPSTFFPGQVSPFWVSLTLVPVNATGKAALDAHWESAVSSAAVLPTAAPRLLLTSSTPQQAEASSEDGELDVCTSTPHELQSKITSADSGLGTSETMSMAQPFIPDFAALNGSSDLASLHYTARSGDGPRQLDLTAVSEDVDTAQTAAELVPPQIVQLVGGNSESTASPTTGRAGFVPAAAVHAALLGSAQGDANLASSMLSPVSWAEEAQGHIAVERGGWSKASAGGPPSAASVTFHKNPHFALTITAAASTLTAVEVVKCVFILSQDPRLPKAALGEAKAAIQRGAPEAAPRNAGSAAKPGAPRNHHSSYISPSILGSVSSGLVEVLAAQVSAAAVVAAPMLQAIETGHSTKIGRSSATSHRKLPIGLVCMHFAGVSSSLTDLRARLLQQPAFTDAHQVCVQAPLSDLHFTPAATDKTQQSAVVTIVPCTYKAGLIGSFTLLAYAPPGCTVSIQAVTAPFKSQSSTPPLATGGNSSPNSEPADGGLPRGSGGGSQPRRRGSRQGPRGGSSAKAGGGHRSSRRGGGTSLPPAQPTRGVVTSVQIVTAQRGMQGIASAYAGLE